MAGEKKDTTTPHQSTVVTHSQPGPASSLEPHGSTTTRETAAPGSHTTAPGRVTNPPSASPSGGGGGTSDALALGVPVGPESPTNPPVPVQPGGEKPPTPNTPEHMPTKTILPATTVPNDPPKAPLPSGAEAPPKLTISGVPGGPFAAYGPGFSSKGSVIIDGRPIETTAWYTNASGMTTIKGTVPVDAKPGASVEIRSGSNSFTGKL